MKAGFRIGVLVVIALGTVWQPVVGQDIEAFIEEIQAELELTDEQADSLGKLMAVNAMQYQAAVEAMDAEEEPDPQASLKEFKKAREAYQKGAQEILSEEQWTAYQAYLDQEMTEMMSDIAEIRLLDMKAPLELTDDQITALKPVMATGMKGVLQTLYKYGDKKMNMRTKIKVGKQLKSIKSQMETGMAAILSEEQMTALAAYQESKKAE